MLSIGSPKIHILLFVLVNGYQGLNLGRIGTVGLESKNVQIIQDVAIPLKYINDFAKVSFPLKCFISNTHINTKQNILLHNVKKLNS